MTKTIFVRSFIAASALAAFAAPAAQAATQTVPCSVTLVTPLSIGNAVSMNFGTLSAPTTADQTFALASTDAAVTSGAGDGKVFADAARAAGSITVTGAKGKKINITGAISNWDGTGVSNTADTIDINGVIGAGTTARSLTIDATSGTVACKVGTGITIAKGTAAGVHAATLTLTVVYE